MLMYRKQKQTEAVRPASNNCDIWKEPLRFSSHLILVAFGPGSRVWQRVLVRLGTGEERAGRK